MESVCSHCHQGLPDDGKSRKRNRPRRCPDCIKKEKEERLRLHPEIKMAHRWGNTCRKHWPNAPTTLYSAKTVKYVMDRFENKSVISGEDDLQYLCIYPYYRGDTPPDYKYLVLVTSKEAQSIARCKTQEEQNERFPAHVREMMAKEPEQPALVPE